ncbi:mRNA interferase YafQ [Breoghania corrubedonensis]|uniref:mRNA interferase YafQ n=1 Tax=Breoghania corrubedonensis TaxID=665038 RepID=A0A2T5VF37_9HYPH|nr:type II toxin-antitoxin system YafQ family toxin [Breoghania corrubedonensis]PTW62371.1 mRNA interferase YafQ [Breoghania corrubedonensis]
MARKGKGGPGSATKRAPLPRCATHTKQFVKDWKRLNGAGRHDMSRLKHAMSLLVANDAPLPPEWKDHPLAGEWNDHRECHIGGDFLLIYTLEERENLIVFVRIGTHAELFRE